jgi:hypothetical protein
MSVAASAAMGIRARASNLNDFQLTTVWILVVLAVSALNIVLWRGQTPSRLEAGVMGAVVGLGAAFVVVPGASATAWVNPLAAFGLVGLKISVALVILVLALMAVLTAPR